MADGIDSLLAGLGPFGALLGALIGPPKPQPGDTQSLLQGLASGTLFGPPGSLWNSGTANTRPPPPPPPPPPGDGSLGLKGVPPWVPVKGSTFGPDAPNPSAIAAMNRGAYGNPPPPPAAYKGPPPGMGDLVGVPPWVPTAGATAGPMAPSANAYAAGNVGAYGNPPDPAMEGSGVAAHEDPPPAAAPNTGWLGSGGKLDTWFHDAANAISPLAQDFTDFALNPATQAFAQGAGAYLSAPKHTSGWGRLGAGLTAGATGTEQAANQQLARAAGQENLNIAKLQEQATKQAMSGAPEEALKSLDQMRQGMIDYSNTPGLPPELKQQALLDAQRLSAIAAMGRTKNPATGLPYLTGGDIVSALTGFNPQAEFQNAQQLAMMNRFMTPQQPQPGAGGPQQSAQVAQQLGVDPHSIIKPVPPENGGPGFLVQDPTDHMHRLYLPDASGQYRPTAQWDDAGTHVPLTAPPGSTGKAGAGAPTAPVKFPGLPWQPTDDKHYMISPTKPNQAAVQHPNAPDDNTDWYWANKDPKTGQWVLGGPASKVSGVADQAAAGGG